MNKSILSDNLFVYSSNITTIEKQFLVDQKEHLYNRRKYTLDYVDNVDDNISSLIEWSFPKSYLNKCSFKLFLNDEQRIDVRMYHDKPSTTYSNIFEGGHHIICQLASGSNYGHFIHDHCSVIHALLSNKNNRLYYTPFDKQMNGGLIESLATILPAEFFKRIVFMDKNTQVVITNPLSLGSTKAAGSRGYALPNISNKLLDHVHNNIIKKTEQKYLIYNVRKPVPVEDADMQKRDTYYPQNDEISVLLKEYAYQNNLIYHEYSGRNTLKYQIELFQQAKIIVGFHGAGMTNIAWAQRNNNVHIIEFLYLLQGENTTPHRFGPNIRSAVPEKYRHGVLPCSVEPIWAFFGLRQSHDSFWGNNILQHMKTWNIIPCTRDSNKIETYIDLNDLKNILNDLS